MSAPPRTLLMLAALAVAAGCSPKIGDKCTVSTDCSATGDRLCDITEPGGYCTVFNCEPDSCPDDAACINFGATLSNLVEAADGGSSTHIVPACTASQGNSPYQRSFCMASCEGDGDCRGGYQCIEPADVGGVKVDRNRSNKVCAVPRSGPPPTLDDAGPSDQVCLGASGSGADAGDGSAGLSGGGASGADNAGAGG